MRFGSCEGYGLANCTSQVRRVHLEREVQKSTERQDIARYIPSHYAVPVTETNRGRSCCWWSSSSARLVPFWVARMTGVLHASLCGRCVTSSWLPKAWLAGPWLFPLLDWVCARTKKRKHATTTPLRVPYMTPFDVFSPNIFFLAFQSCCSCSSDPGAPAAKGTGPDRTPLPSGTGPCWVSRGGRTENAGRGTERIGWV